MIKYTYGLCILLFAICSCSKNDEGIDWSNYQSTALLNDTISWSAEQCWFGPYVPVKNEIGINLNHSNSFGELREQIVFSKLPLTVEKIPLKYIRRGSPVVEPIAAFNTFTSDGDAATEGYDLLERLSIDNYIDNYITIDWISEDSTEISGTYQLTLIISQKSPPKLIESRPDTLVYTNGTFKARLLLPRE